MFVKKIGSKNVQRENEKRRWQPRKLVFMLARCVCVMGKLK